MSLGKILEEVLAKEQCFSIKNLSINGHDVMSLGIPEGRQVGNILEKLLDDVINDRLKNEHTLLVQAALKYKEECNGA